MGTLLAYLREPDLKAWNRRARALVTGIVAAPVSGASVPPGTAAS